MVKRVYRRAMRSTDPPGPSLARVTGLARRATGRPDAAVARWVVEPSPHRVENMTTERLERVAGELDDGTAWSVFAKTLHPASEAAGFQLVPPEFRAQVLEDLDWHDEPRLYRTGLGAGLPDGFRLPGLFGVDESPTRITLWLEDVADDAPWDLARYHRTAVLLGRCSGRWPERRAGTELRLRRRPMARLFFGKITHLDLPAQADDGFWADPRVAAVVDDRHRADLAWLASATPALVEREQRLPHALCHGDATPDNFREPGDGTVVAIDWSYGSCCPYGADLSQLLAGRVESGALPADEIGAVAECIFDGYRTGLQAEGATVPADHVEAGWATHLAVRSVFSALLLDHRPDLGPDDPARCELLARRAALARFGLDLVAEVLGGRRE
jgi:hypothetical protein